MASSPSPDQSGPGPAKVDGVRQSRDSLTAPTSQSGLGSTWSRSPALAWAYVVTAATVALAHGAFWTRGVLGDDLCMCELATLRGFWDAVEFWLQTTNSRLLLAVAHIGSYQLPWFARPLEAPWFVLHGIVVLAHMATCCLLLNILSRASVAAGPSLAALLVFAIHPVTAESVLWLAAAYGYVFGSLLTVLAVWTYLEYERNGRRRWLVATTVLSLAATLGIEQFLPMLGALACTHLLRSRRHRTARPAWIPLAIVGCCALAFLAMHFVLFPGTGGRLAHAASKVDAVVRPGMLWHLAWWLSLVPEHSPWGGTFRMGLHTLQQSMWLVAGVAAATLMATWRVAAAGSWSGVPARAASTGNQALWVMAAGFAPTLASLIPFAFTGYIGLSQRNAYVMLPGLVVAAAAALDAAASRWTLVRLPRYALALSIAAGVAMSLVIGAGAQASYAQQWQTTRKVIAILESHSDAIRSAGGLQVIVASQSSSKVVLPVHPWMFPCLVRWVVNDGKVNSWIGSDPNPDGAQLPAGSHRIYIQVR